MASRQNKVDVIYDYIDIAEKEIIIAVKQNNESIEKQGVYHSRGLQLLFKEWHRHFPHIKQQLGCRGCREAVTKFWNNVNKIWESNN